MVFMAFHIKRPRTKGNRYTVLVAAETICTDIRMKRSDMSEPDTSGQRSMRKSTFRHRGLPKAEDI
jgi:hypothetical protein